jgi:hypothetical protein
LAIIRFWMWICNHKPIWKKNQHFIKDSRCSFFTAILLLYWGCIMTFTKVLKIYPVWIHPSIILLHPPSHIPGIVSTSLCKIEFYLLDLLKRMKNVKFSNLGFLTLFIRTCFNCCHHYEYTQPINTQSN